MTHPGGTPSLRGERPAMPVALTIAGSDSGGGAGVQADLATFRAFGVFGTSVVTSITAQTFGEVRAITAVDDWMVRQQLETVLDGFAVRALKTGALISAAIVEVVAETVRRRRLVNLVVDPVLHATRGGRLLDDDALERCRAELVPLAALVTPNVPELSALTGISIADMDGALAAARALRDRTGAAVLVKAGHLDGPADDYLVEPSGVTRVPGTRVDGVNGHGSGCRLSAAITAALARGVEMKHAVIAAKRHIEDAFARPITLATGQVVLGPGAVDPMFERHDLATAEPVR